MVAIVIPIYKNTPSANDLVSLTQCFKVLGEFPIIVVKPESLDLVNYPFVFSEVIPLEDRYFKSISSYNELMMSSVFYQRFLNYRYILIYQTDAFVFKNELLAWCNKKYDYIGAPWLRGNLYPDVFKMGKEEIRGSYHRVFNIKQRDTHMPSTKQIENRVGNGGLSLRRTRKFHDLCMKKKRQAEKYLEREGPMYNEDVFWSIEINRFRRVLKIPSYKTAVHFSIEGAPEVALKLTHGELPFGCHAWDLHIDFFRPLFLSQGYKI